LKCWLSGWRCNTILWLSATRADAI
jgi:hypothetical protein